MFAALRTTFKPRAISPPGIAFNACRPTESGYQTMKNRVLLENYFLPSDLERRIGTFVD